MAPHASKAAARAEARKGITTDFQDLNLHSACANGNIGLAKYALLNGQPVNSVLNGVQPIHAAASSGNEAIVRMLIENGADVNAARLPRRYTGEKTRSSVAVGTSGSTALHFAAANGHTEVLRILLAYGADPAAREKYGLTPDQLAAKNGHSDAAGLLQDAMHDTPLLEDPSSSRTSLKSIGKKRLHPQRSFDALALKMTQQVSNPHIPSLNLYQPGSQSRRSSISSTMTDETRRSILPIVLEKGSSVRNVIGNLAGLRKPIDEQTPVKIPEEDMASSASSALSRNNSASSYNSRVAHGYRPRLSSNLSGRRAPSPEEAAEPPAQAQAQAPAPTPTSESGRAENRVSSALFRQHVRDRSHSNASSGSSYSKRAGGVSPFAKVHPAVATRGSRSNSVGTEARSPSSPSSSYSGFGQYAPSTTTTVATSTCAAAALAPASAHAPTTSGVSQATLSPLYEAAPVKRSDTSSSSITTSAEAHSHAQKMERDILSTKPSSGTPAIEGRSALAQKLAAYGHTLSLEKKLKAMELKEAPSYRWETIGKDGTHQETPVTAGQLKAPAEILGSSPVKASSSPKQSKSPGRRASVEEFASVPHWKAIPSGDRLVPPPGPATSKHRSASPVGSVSASTAMARTKSSRDKLVASSSSASAATTAQERPASPASTSGSSGVLARGPPHGISYEVISSPQHSASGARATVKKSKGTGSSDKAPSNKASSVASARDQVVLDAAEQARIEATIPRAQPPSSSAATTATKKKRIFG